MSEMTNMAAMEPINHGRRQHHRVISTNNLFSSFGLDIMQQDSLTGISVAPTERIAAQQFNPALSSQAALSGAFHPVINTQHETIERARFHARGLQAGVDMAPMFGDRPPQSPQSPTRPRVPSTQLPSAYSQGMGIDTSTHYSFQPNLLLQDKEVDYWMAEWEQELFTNYRRTKYYSGYEEMSKERTAEIVVGFTGAALQAYKKLETAAKSDHVSDGFKLFVNGLGGFESLTRSGFRNLDRVLEGGTPQNLTGVYSVLHVAYAMSQTTSDQIRQSPNAPTIDQFKQDARRNWRQCLPKERNGLGYYERSVFDELLVVMTQEVDSALQWIKERTYMNQLTNSEEQEDQNNAELCTISPEPLTPDSDIGFDLDFGAPSLDVHQSKYRSRSVPPESLGQHATCSNWGKLMNGSILKGTVHFLNELSKLGVMFQRLCGLPHFALRGRQINALDPEPDFEKFKKMIHALVIAPTCKSAEWKSLVYVIHAASNMLEFGAIRTLRDFENYMVTISTLCSDGLSRGNFVRSFVIQCGKVAQFFGKYARHQYQTPYSVKYILKRLEKETGAQTPQEDTRSDSSNGISLFAPRGSFDGAAYTTMGLRASPVPLSRTPSMASNQFQGVLAYGQSFHQPALSSAYTPSLQAMTAIGDFDDLVSSDVDAPSETSQQMMYGEAQELGAQDMRYHPFFGLKGTEYPAPNNASASPGQSPIDSSSPHGSASSFSARSSPNTSFSDISAIHRPLGYDPIPPMPKYETSALCQNVFSGSEDLDTLHSNMVGPATLATSSSRKTQRRGRKQAEGRKFICDIPGCGAEIRGSKFTMSNSNLLRHKRSAHPEQRFLTMEFDCLEQGCNGKYRGARGMENLKTHYRVKHGRRMTDEESNMISRLAGDDPAYFGSA